MRIVTVDAIAIMCTEVEVNRQASNTTLHEKRRARNFLFRQVPLRIVYLESAIRRSPLSSDQRQFTSRFSDSLNLYPAANMVYDDHYTYDDPPLRSSHEIDYRTRTPRRVAFSDYYPRSASPTRSHNTRRYSEYRTAHNGVMERSTRSHDKRHTDVYAPVPAWTVQRMPVRDPARSPSREQTRAKPAEHELQDKALAPGRESRKSVMNPSFRRGSGELLDLVPRHVLRG